MKTDKECSCGSGCKCKGDYSKLIIKSAVTLVSAAIIAGAIISSGPTDPMRGMRPVGGPDFKGRGMDKGPGFKGGDAAMRDFIMRNPKVLIDSVDAYYRAQQPKDGGGCGPAPGDQAKPAAPAKPFSLSDLAPAPADIVSAISSDKTNYSLGNAKGKFVVIEFFDYQCGWCKKTNAALEEVVKSKDGANIRWIPIDTPIFGEASELIARYALAAGKQGKYAEYHAAVGQAKGKLDEAALQKIGADLKLDAKKLKADVAGKEIAAKLAANKELAKKMNVSGVPMLIVDGRVNPGALIGDRLDAVVKAAKAKK
ncbi:MAG: DsbA family protein [Alphaproteobacteria bacterium]|nr:DsbA family protein [Alphaproteobacteria bacterium]